MRVSAVITVAVLGAAINLASQATVAREVCYTSGNNGAAIFAIIVQGNKVTTKTVGSPGVPGCGSLAMSKWGTLYAVCGDLFGVQQLATIDIHTGHATMFGAPTAGLAVMTITFGPDGTLYAVGDCNPDFSVPECKPGKDPNFNSLYTIDVSTGAFSRAAPPVHRSTSWTWHLTGTDISSV